jgi:hypothetical protein
LASTTNKSSGDLMEENGDRWWRATQSYWNQPFYGDTMGYNERQWDIMRYNGMCTWI